MTEQNQPPAELKHPITGVRMVLDKAVGSEAMRHRLERNIGIPEGGRQVLERVREKEADRGHVYVDPLTGYRARLRADGTDASADSDAGTRAPSASASSSQAASAETREAETERLERRLAELRGDRA